MTYVKKCYAILIEKQNKNEKSSNKSTNPHTKVSIFHGNCAFEFSLSDVNKIAPNYILRCSSNGIFEPDIDIIDTTIAIQHRQGIKMFTLLL